MFNANNANCAYAAWGIELVVSQRYSIHGTRHLPEVSIITGNPGLPHREPTGYRFPTDDYDDDDDDGEAYRAIIIN